MTIKTDPRLLAALQSAKARVDAMTEAEREDMYRKQRESYVRAEISRPKAIWWMDRGVKVYASYEDYCND